MRTFTAIMIVLAIGVSGCLGMQSPRLNIFKEVFCANYPGSSDCKSLGYLHLQQERAICRIAENSFERAKNRLVVCAYCPQTKLQVAFDALQRVVNAAGRVGCSHPTQVELDALKADFAPIKPVAEGEFYPSEAQIKFIFGIFDVNKSGRISLTEVRNASKRAGASFTEEDQKMFEAMDTDKDGALNFEEFRTGFLSTLNK